MKAYWAVLGVLVLSGCPDAPTGSTSTDSVPHSAIQNDKNTANPAGNNSASGAPAGGSYVVQLDAYQLNVPFGALSRNDEFWKRVDETQIEPATYDVLVKNGVRVGTADLSDWTYFKSLVDRYQATGIQGTATPVKEAKLEIPLKSGVEYQDLFYFDDRNVLYGRTFERCDNVLAVDFAASRMRQGDTIIRICPIVRGLRKRFEVSVLNEEREITLVRPEQIIDLRLKTEVQDGHFLILGPSRSAKWPTSLGQTFLVNQGHAGMNETVLLLVPHAYRVGERSNSPDTYLLPH